MRIYFDNISWDAESTGPCSFAKRLTVQLGNMGHTLADHDDYDVALVFIEPTTRLDLKKPFVHRVDGMWFRPDQHKMGMNAGIEWAHRNAHAVVHQSDFDKQMLTRWLGEPKRCVTIRNGAPIEPATLRSEAFIGLRERFDKVFVCSAQWHPQKRLRDNIAVFKHIRATQHPNSCLIVMGGNAGQQAADPAIFYTGSIRHDLCAEAFSMADWMIHAAWLDHCPNSVVEAIAQGCPVLCSSEGGTKELALPSNGVVVADASSYSFGLVDYDDPPRLPLANVPILPEGFRADPSSVGIVQSAQAYADVLSSVL